ncbi:Probable molybdopterin-guanine dinucleotide biosynthesis protein A [uncultured Clostridium sp.]|nr:Probable molybdopterin-guanine dinucleotide biosynthesis protein A [uncultured Clostridium sp.]
MGSDKSDLPIGESTFLECQIRKGRKLGITDIQVSGYRGACYSAPVTPDRFPGKGPLGGLESCFRLARERQVLVLGVDIPLVPVEELERLVLRSREKQKKAVILRHRGKEEPLAGVYDRDLADEMLAEIRERKGSVFAFLNRIGYDICDSAAPEESFANINRPEDYHRRIVQKVSDK